ncbi:MAG: substrate-binding domain-containing protein [Spirochaetales bacterium]|nr:substrate-binding domain-containing protein [Spirochaetales bacterium]
MPSYKFQKCRPTIGVLINQIEGRYQTDIIKGISDYAREHDINLIYFAGKSLESPYEGEKACNIIFDLINPGKLDGLILASGSIANYISEEKYLQFAGQFRSIPNVSLSTVLEGIPSIITDNSIGMTEAVSHLIQVHGYRKIGFLKGTPTNHEAKERYEIYLKTLKSHDIPLDPNIIFEGDFTYIAGLEIARKIIKENIKMNALMCGNDEMALAAFEAFNQNGTRIPEDIALTGFDDIEDVKTLTPPMTTIRQPLYEQGQKACELIMNMLEGNTVEEVISFPARLVVRGSCGCFSGKFLNDDDKTIINITSGKKEKSIDKSFIKDIHDLTVKNMNAVPVINRNRDSILPYLNQLLENLYSDLENQNITGVFPVFLEKIIKEDNESGHSDTYWPETLYLIRRLIIGSEHFPAINPLLLDELFQRGQLLTGKGLKRNAENRLYRLKRYLWQIWNFISQIDSHLEIESLLRCLEVSLETLNITGCHLALYKKNSAEDDRSSKIPRNSELILSIENGKKLVDSRFPKFYFSNHILPDSIVGEARRYSLIILPLHNRDQQFGYIIFEESNVESFVYELLREQISNALQTIRLFQEQLATEKKLMESLEALKKSEERYRDIAVLLPTLIVETDLNFNVTFLNKATFETIKLNEDEMAPGTSFLRFIHPDDEERVKDYFYQVINKSANQFCEFRVQNKEGTDVTLICKAVPIEKEKVVEGVRWNAISLKPVISSFIAPDDRFFTDYEFTKREKEVIMLLMEGLRIREIAKKMCITESTVKGHLNQIYTRANVANKEGFFELIQKYQVNHFGYHSFIFSLLSNVLKNQI